MAFEYYKQKKADVVSLEVGMGGRLDATNIVDPLVSIIVSIGLDHKESLGETVYDIASILVLNEIKYRGKGRNYKAE
jgi:dihydrofolate synthase/folylpolyglutamate synthase